MWAIQSAHVRQYKNAWLTCLGFALSFVKHQLCDCLQAWLHTVPHRTLGMLCVYSPAGLFQASCDPSNDQVAPFDFSCVSLAR